jgi:hypothetical protein
LPPGDNPFAVNKLLLLLLLLLLLFYHQDDIWWGLQIIKLFMTQFSPASS